MHIHTFEHFFWYIIKLILPDMIKIASFHKYWYRCFNYNFLQSKTERSACSMHVIYIRRVFTEWCNFSLWKKRHDTYYHIKVNMSCKNKLCLNRDLLHVLKIILQNMTASICVHKTETHFPSALTKMFLIAALFI